MTKKNAPSLNFHWTIKKPAKRKISKKFQWLDDLLGFDADDKKAE